MSLAAPHALPLLEDEELIFLKKSFSKELLVRYYDELLVPLIPFEDERDSLNKIQSGLKTPPEKLQAENSRPSLNVCLITSKGGENEDKILYGAVQFEYYFGPNCGLMNYLLVNENYRGRGWPKSFVSIVQAKLEVIAKDFGHLAGLIQLFSFCSLVAPHFLSRFVMQYSRKPTLPQRCLLLMT